MLDFLKNFCQIIKIIVTLEEKLKQVYKVLFINNYEGSQYEITIGQYTFYKSSKDIFLRTASLLS